MARLCSCCGKKLTQVQARYEDTGLGRRIVCKPCHEDITEIRASLRTGEVSLKDAVNYAMGTD